MEEFNSTLDKAKYVVNDQRIHINYDYYDGERFVYFEIINIINNTAEMIIEKDGRVNVTEYDLFEDINSEHYFEYINPYNRIYLNKFDIDENL